MMPVVLSGERVEETHFAFFNLPCTQEATILVDARSTRWWLQLEDGTWQEIIQRMAHSEAKRPYPAAWEGVLGFCEALKQLEIETLPATLRVQVYRGMRISPFCRVNFHLDEATGLYRPLTPGALKIF